jgi:hypothetical protein
MMCGCRGRMRKIKVLQEECSRYCIVEYGVLSDPDSLFIPSMFVTFGIIFAVQFSQNFISRQ